MLIWGAVVCASCLTIVSGLNIGISPATNASQKAGLAMIFIWYFTFGVRLLFHPPSSELQRAFPLPSFSEPSLFLAEARKLGEGIMSYSTADSDPL